MFATESIYTQSNTKYIKSQLRINNNTQSTIPHYFHKKLKLFNSLKYCLLLSLETFDF